MRVNWQQRLRNVADQYIIRQSSKPRVWEIAKFSDDYEPSGIYNVKLHGKNYSCDCPGYWRQKNKDEHKHIRLVKFWRENLEEEHGFALWLDGPDIEYSRFCDSI